jgi:hypothetical protein
MAIPHKTTKPKSRIRVNELKAPPTIKAYRASMRDVRKSVGELFKSVMPTLQAYINIATDSEGNLVFSRRAETARLAGEAVHRLFVGQDGRSAFAQDGVSAVSKYSQLLNEFYVRVTLEAVYAQRAWLKKNVPADIFQWLSRSRFDIRLSESENPFIRRDGETDEEFMQRMRDLRVFHPNPLAELDPNRQWVPMHLWTDPNGYVLSQRIWNTANDVRSKIDAFIMKAFAEGWSAVQLAKELEQYLVDGAGGYAAMRLARTEIARAANHAAYVSAYLNPYVSKIDVARSANGDPSCNICKQHATIGIGGERTRPPYSIHAAHIPSFHSNCMCHVRPVLDDNPAAVTQRLQAVMQDARVNSFPPPVTPANADAFTNMLLHRALGSLVGQFKGQLPLLGF